MVPTHHLLTREPGRVATAIGLSRVVLGAGFLVNPVATVRFLGVDSGSAKRMTFLARMTAGRDIALGLGTVAARTPRSKAAWLAAGALADAVDGAVLAVGLRTGQLRGAPAAGVALGAAGATGLALIAADSLRRG